MPVKCALEELKFGPEFRERQASADGGSDRVLDPGAREEYSSVFYFFFVFFFFCLFVVVVVAISWAAPAAYGGSQARGLIGSVATGLRHNHSNQNHSNAGSKPSLRPIPYLMATPDP